MKFRSLLFLLLFIANSSFAQNTFRAIIKDDKNNFLPGASATISKLKLSTTANDTGVVTISNIPNGEFEIEFSFTGFEERKKIFKFPLSPPGKIFEIELELKPDELDEVVVTTTRSGRTIQNTPTRVEVLSSDELNEKGLMQPANIRMMFNETTGVTTKQTSTVSASAGIRIQGLEGQYTQLLKDGMPLYGDFSGGLSIMQIAPLDLKQVEFIKGSASTLYGGGAIAGLINLISKVPQQKQELSFLLNATSAKAFDGSGFYSQKWKKVGTTIFGSYNFNSPYDPANIGFTAIPKTNRFSFNPKLFLYFNEKTSAWLAVNTTFEDRFGGDMNVVKGNADNIHQYFERNKTVRISTQLSFTHEINAASKINFKNSINFFDRKISNRSFYFKGQQTSSFSEINYSHTKERSEWIAGVNVLTENFNSLEVPFLNFHQNTFGAFAQNSFKPADWFTLETGLRVDNNVLSGTGKLNSTFILPRINALFKFNQHLTSRIGGGFGYKMPSAFSDESERIGYNNILPFSFSNKKPERSYGANADVNYKTFLGDIRFTIDQLFFYTYLKDPFLLTGNSFANAQGFIDTKGFETNAKFIKDHLNLFIGYTYTYAKQHFNSNSDWQTLTPKHLLNVDLAYEKENNIRTGIEMGYVSEQKLSNGATGKGYIMFGFLFLKTFGKIDVYVNAENLTDRRQTRWENIYTGPISNPLFKEIYAPLDGAVFNGGIKIKL